ncbi:MAG: efflux RND transporter periplasmic adaptor subunit [Chthoniobacter sp.]
MNTHPEYIPNRRHDREGVDVLDAGELPEPTPHSRHAVTEPQSKPPRLGRLTFIIVVVVAVCLVVGLLPRLHDHAQVISDSRDLAIATVAVVTPGPAKVTEPLVLSGELQPLISASIYARANGYVRRWLVDLGAHVEAGQLLAELDTPEIDRQLSQARAELNQAEAALTLAATTAKRWKEMLSAKTVSSQEADEKAADLELKKASVAAAQANVERLTEVAGFAHVTAPFAGTITARNLDVGQLVNAGAGQELYRLALTDKLRVFVHVPQNYSRGTKVGQIGELTLPEAPDQKYPAKVVRTAGALDITTRTLLVELEVDNANGEILAGSYGLVRLADSHPEAELTLPASSVIFRSEGPQVGVVVDNHLSLRKIKLGRDFGSVVEVLSGVVATDHVITNPTDSFADGMEVRVLETPPAPKPAEPAKH